MSNYTADGAAINRVLTDYVEGMTFGDEARLRQAFHPSCKIIGNYHGALEWASLDEFMGMHFTDYLSLLQVGNGWQIVNKLYYLHE